MKLSYPRYHVSSKTCKDLHPLINLGARYYLSTTTGSLSTNIRTLMVSCLTIYNFPCNVTFKGMKLGLSYCPKRMEISLPVFEEQTMQYIPWDIEDDINLKLHYESLSIPKATKFTDNITKQLNELYDLYDHKFNIDMEATKKKIDDIQDERRRNTIVP